MLIEKNCLIKLADTNIDKTGLKTPVFIYICGGSSPFHKVANALCGLGGPFEP